VISGEAAVGGAAAGEAAAGEAAAGGGAAAAGGSAAAARPVGAALSDVVANRYRRGVDVAVVWLVALWFLGGNLVTIVPAAAHYRSLVVELAAFGLMGGIGAAGAIRLLRHRTGAAQPRLLAAGALGCSAAATAMLPAPAVFAGNWAWDATGWIGVLVLLRRPLLELSALLAANAGLTLAMLAYDGVTDRVSLSRFAAVTYATTALQVAVVLGARAVDAAARRAAAAAEAEAALRRERQVAEELHASRRDRYRTVRGSVAPLLAGLASGELDPAEADTRRRCAVGASRLRRLFAETDDIPDPLLHELRACIDIADRQGVLVDLVVVGRMPELAVPTRRALTEAPLHALACAQRHARVTVVGRRDEVSISVLADGRPPDPADWRGCADPAVAVTVQDGVDRQWIEARWRRR
jgi:hypothetical protein